MISFRDRRSMAMPAMGETNPAPSVMQVKPSINTMRLGSKVSASGTAITL